MGFLKRQDKCGEICSKLIVPEDDHEEKEKKRIENDLRGKILNILLDELVLCSLISRKKLLLSYVHLG